ncbi:unnamed protein product [Rotaria magnacalcarata]
MRGSQTDGRIIIMEGEILVGEGPPIHIHHREYEYFHVLKGELEFEVGDQNVLGTADTRIHAPRFVKHRYRNVNSTGARLQFVFQPAGIEHYFEEVSKVIVAQQLDCFAIDITQSDFVVNQSGGGQKLHVLPYPNAYYRIVLHGNQTNNQVTIIEGVIYINEGARLHYHMNEDEMFFVINGTLQFAVGGKQFCARAGTSVYISRNIKYCCYSMPPVTYPALAGYYELQKTIGNGGFGKVKQAIHLLTGEHVAIKIIDKAKLGSDVARIALEIKAMKDLRHQHICQLYQVIETDEYYFLVLEYFCNGELFDYIVNRNRLSEEQARHFFRQIVSAVAYMHKKGYCHRDLKPENLLLDRRENLKLIDFGLCAQPTGGINLAYLGTACGSPAYAAPEIIAGTTYRGDVADVWSLGVLLYALLCGSLPFDDENIASMYAKIQNGVYHIPSWLSQESVALLRLMLQVDPPKRIRIDDLLRHRWLINNVYPEPIKWESIYHNKLEISCIREMSLYYGRTVNDLAQELSSKKYDYMTATYFILYDLKSRNKPIRLLPNRVQSIHSRAFDGHHHPASSIPANLLREKNQDLTPRSRTVHRHPPPADLLLISQQNKTHVPSPHANRSTTPSHTEQRHRSHKTPNKENVENSHTKRHERTTPTVKAPNCQRILMFAESPSGSKRTGEKKGDHRLSASKSFDDGLDDNNLDDSKIASALKAFSVGAVDSDDLDVYLTPQRQKKNVRSLFGSVERGLNTVKQILTPKRTNGNKPRKTWETANVTPIHIDDPDQVCDLLEQAIKNNSQLQYKEKGSRFVYDVFIEDDWGKIVLEFDLEVVTIQGKELGIQRKRTKGSAWHYKRCCEDIIRQLTRLLPNLQTSV